MTKPALCLFACLTLSVFTGCGVGDPREVIVGAWGLDVTVVEEDGKKLSEPMAVRMHQMKLEAMRGMRLTLAADGTATMSGAQGNQRGAYTVDKVDGDKVTVTITYEGGRPDMTVFQVHSSDRITMVPGDRTVTLPLIRK